MELSVHEAAKRLGEVFPFSLSQELGTITYCGRQLAFKGPAKARGAVSGDGGGFTVEGCGEVVFLSRCARCNEPFEEPFSFTFRERFVRPGMAGKEEECYPYEGDTLELRDAYLDNLLLQMPLVSLCREDCRGLCPICGINLNRGRCRCTETNRSNPFDVLRTLSFENKEV